jgi:hypothetical protein
MALIRQNRRASFALSLQARAVLDSRNRDIAIAIDKPA